MTSARAERWWAASGFGWLILGAAGGAMERGWPSGGDPAAVARFIAEHRSAILAQSLLFVLSAGVAIAFLTSLHHVLRRAEGGDGPLSAIALAAGLVWAGITMVAQAIQIGASMPGGELPPVFLSTMSAIFGIANLPLAIMLMATTALSLTSKVFPAWLASLSAAAAAAQLLLFLGTVVTNGPLAPTGWLSYVLYPMFLLWLVPATTLMVRGHHGIAGQGAQVHAQPA
jgi:hypothetical protein